MLIMIVCAIIIASCASIYILPYNIMVTVIIIIIMDISYIIIATARKYIYRILGHNYFIDYYMHNPIAFYGCYIIHMQEVLDLFMSCMHMQVFLDNVSHQQQLLCWHFWHYPYCFNKKLCILIIIIVTDSPIIIILACMVDTSNQ